MDKKLTIITGTNRNGSISEKITNQYATMAEAKGMEVEVIHLKDLPKTFAFSELYGERSEEFQELINAKISSRNKFVFIIAEYNGSFPGVLKTFMDAVPPGEWTGKKAGLIGVSSGRAGALRATDQFTNVLNYLKTSVYYSKPKLAGILGLLNDSNTEIDDETTLQLLEDHIQGIMAF